MSSTRPDPSTLFSAHKNRKLYMTREEMKAANIPPRLRDYCAYLVPALEKCRHRENFLPWKCEHEKLQWEKCQYNLYKDREHAVNVLRKVKLPENTLSSEGKPFPEY